MLTPEEFSNLKKKKKRPPHPAQNRDHVENDQPLPGQGEGEGDLDPAKRQSAGGSRHKQTVSRAPAVQVGQKAAGKQRAAGSQVTHTEEIEAEGQEGDQTPARRPTAPQKEAPAAGQRWQKAAGGAAVQEAEEEVREEESEEESEADCDQQA